MKLSTTLVKLEEDKIYEGLRIPPTLGTTTSVNFVITQEPGKLKPKDLKAAIERNRAERELRAEEQRKIREQGGGAGLLDLRGILSEEKLNASEGDPFKRQLREMAFLADVDEVEKQEIEKSFRISEEYLGSNFLSQEDIDTVYKQREQAKLFKIKNEWKTILARQHTTVYSSSHSHVKSGASATVSRDILDQCHPLFDPNRNDIWNKRMNTLRRFVSLVSRWLIQKRVTDRMRRLRKFFSDNNANTREEVLAFIDKENELNRKKGSSNATTVAKNNERKVDFSAPGDGKEAKKPASVALMVFAQPNPKLESRKQQEAIINEANASQELRFTPDMMRRILFPKGIVSNGGGEKKPIAPVDLNTLLSFEDRTFFQLKLRPDFITQGYKPHGLPTVPLYFPDCNEKTLRRGAPEEYLQRPPADKAVTSLEDVNRWLVDQPPEPALLSQWRSDAIKGISEAELAAICKSTELPAWMSEEPSWESHQLDYFREDQAYRVYDAYPRRCELDADWRLRPDAEQLVYEKDGSLRTALCAVPGFKTANTYLLGSYETRNKDPPPPPGPTLTDFYCPNTDRHVSGLWAYSNDHLRGTIEHDPDVAPLQAMQDPLDYLTDDESDAGDDDPMAVEKNKPSMEKARKLLHPPKKEEPVAVDPKAKGAKDKKAAPAPTPKVAAPEPTPTALETNDDMSRLDADQKKEEQVELLRDRKILEMESTLWRSRKQKQDAVSERLVELSKASRCLVQALPVQLPFHVYEEEVYKLLENQFPLPCNTHVETHLRQSLCGDSVNNLSSTFLGSPGGYTKMNILLLGMVYSDEMEPKRGQEYRDRVRCEAVEKLGYNVRTLDNKHKDDEIFKHCTANFTDARRMIKAMDERWGDMKFDHVIMDYFFCPVGWARERWTETLFTKTLPQVAISRKLTKSGKVWLPNLICIQEVITENYLDLSEYFIISTAADPKSNPLYLATETVERKLLMCPDALTNVTQMKPVKENCVDPFIVLEVKDEYSGKTSSMAVKKPILANAQIPATPTEISVTSSTPSSASKVKRGRPRKSEGSADAVTLKEEEEVPKEKKSKPAAERVEVKDKKEHPQKAVKEAPRRSLGAAAKSAETQEEVEEEAKPVRIVTTIPSLAALIGFKRKILHVDDNQSTISDTSTTCSVPSKRGNGRTKKQVKSRTSSRSSNNR